MKTKIMTFKKAIPAALILAGSVGFASNASASAYAISYDNIFGLQVTSSDSDGNNGPFFVPPTAFTAFNATSEVQASQGPLGVPVFGVGGSISNGGPVDMPVAIATGSDFTGLTAPTNNSFTQVGQGGNPAYAYADAQISRTTLAQIPNGPVVINDAETQAWNIAEGFVASSGFAAASTRNSSETGFTTTFELGGDAIFNFDFNADPYLEVAISNDAGSPSTANAELNVIITITDDNGGTVFSWSPDGQAGGIAGGTENLDPFSLNESIEVSSAGAALSIGNAPTGNISPALFGMFSASTDVLSAGTYTISLDMSSLINVTTSAAQAVPNPGVLGLMGLGLAGLGFSRRRKAS
ncbi:MAG: EDSAP-1 family PEP-CTERM protein [Halioglobus sp.]